MSKLTAKDPNRYSALVHYDMAVCKRGLKEYDAAMAEAQKAIRFDANDSDSVYLEALISKDLKQFQLCIDYLNQYLQMNIPDDKKRQAMSFLNDTTVFQNVTLADDLMRRKKFAEAVEKLRSAAARDPTPYSESVHSNLVLALRGLGKFDEAIAESKEALKLQPRDPSVVYAVALSYEGLGKYDQAIEWINKYLKMDLHGRDRESAQHYLECLEEDSKNAKSIFNRSGDYLDSMCKNKRRDLYSWSRNRLPLRVYLPTKVTSKGYRKEFDSFITSALDKWCVASGKKLSYKIVRDKAPCDIEIIWTDQALHHPDEDDNFRVEGLTSCQAYELQGEPAMDSAMVQIMTVSPFDLSQPIEPGECASVCVHELGHALGLGHSTVISDVMYFRSATVQGGVPTKRDARTLARLYGAHPVVAFSPLTDPSAKIKYLPPPCFQPPKLPGVKHLAPPLFTPPPVSGGKIKPPLYTPPPLSATNGGGGSQPQKTPASLLFTPPPIKNAGKAPSRQPSAKAPPLFVPKPINAQ